MSDTPSGALICTICGAEVFPGQVFCDNCGADLRVNQPVQASFADTTTPTTQAVPATPAEPEPPHAVSDTEETLLATPPPIAGAPAVPPENAETMIAPPPFGNENQPAPADTPTTTEAGDRADSPPQATEATEATDGTATAQEDTGVPDEPVATNDAPTMAAPASFVPTPTAQDDAAAPRTEKPATAELGQAPAKERERLEAERAHHQKAIAQMEQMLHQYSEGTEPAYLAVALEDARRALSQTEHRLNALVPAPDPAEVARLEEEVTRHRTTIATMETMLKGYAAGSEPEYLKIAVSDAYRALSQAENDLMALQGGHAAETLPAPPPAEQAAPPATLEVPAPEPLPASAYTDETILAQPAPGQPGAATLISSPRLVILDGGHELPLPTDCEEIIIGREDPVSNIYPEIDLTPFGGEMGGVSRQHARINHQEQEWTITDLNSTNYTRLNGHKLAANEPTPLQDGARLQFGRIAAILKL